MDNSEKKQDMDDINEDLELPMDVDLDDDIEDIEIVACDEDGTEIKDDDSGGEKSKNEKDLDEAREEYLRLYAEFENYKKRAAKDKEEISKYANESIILDILPSLDHLEIALKHARESEDDDAPKSGLMQGVDMTLRELLRTLEKFGLNIIEAEGKPFDPEFHHAVSQVERDDLQEGMVVDDLRKGYVYNGKVVRATMVSVSKKPEAEQGPETE